MEIIHRFNGAILKTVEADNLCVADLRVANLRVADLRGADLCGANLCGADLRGADLRGADLCKANLCGANLRGADLCGADLREADLREADLRRADLCAADLRRADLRAANLHGADFHGANLRGAYLSWRSHELMAELISQEAGNDLGLLSFAGLVVIQKRDNWCWGQFLALREHAIFGPLLQRSLEILSAYVREGDGSPECVRSIAASQRQKAETA